MGQTVPEWHTDDFEWKLPGEQLVQGHSGSTLSPKSKQETSRVKGTLSVLRSKKTSFSPEIGTLELRVVETNLVTLLIYHLSPDSTLNF